MALESATHINQLVSTNPTGGDQKSGGDDHIRMLKAVLQTDFPGITGPVTATQAELNILDGITATTAELNTLDGVMATAAEINYLVGVTSAIQAQLNAKSPSLRGHIAGLTLSTAGASATMSISAGQATDSTVVSSMSLGAFSKTTSAWALGSAAGGLDTGTIAASTWYHFFIIQRPDTGVVDALISLSATAPTLPTNYTLFRRIGSGKTDGSSQWTSFTQDGDYFIWSASVLDITQNNPSLSEVLCTLSVPTGVSVIANIQGILVNVGSALAPNARFYDPSQNDETTGTTLMDLSPASAAVGYQIRSSGRFNIRTNTSAQIGSKVGNASSTDITLYIRTLGWYDTRGRFT